MFTNIENSLILLAKTVPLEFFTFFASIVEEIIAPIPSPIIMTVTGSLASVQGRGISYLFLLTILGSLGKLLGSLVVYYLADKIEDYFSGVMEKFFGVSHADIESFGKKFTGKTKDYLIMFFMRAIPIVPSSVVSIGSGVLKIPLKIFVVSTFLGSIVRDFLYIYFGYAGLSVLGDIIHSSESIESIIQLIVFILILSGLVYAYFKKRKNEKLPL
ncbi:MAG: VTT domain-containing protein [Minisyncoccia bacterium]